MSFEWELTAIPEDVPGFRPTAHVILDSRYINGTLLNDIKTLLYGSAIVDPAFPPFETLMTIITTS